MLVNFDATLINNKERVIFLQSLSKYLSKNRKIGEILNDIFILNIKSLRSIENTNLLPVHALKKN